MLDDPGQPSNTASIVICSPVAEALSRRDGAAPALHFFTFARNARNVGLLAFLHCRRRCGGKGDE